MSKGPRWCRDEEQHHAHTWTKRSSGAEWKLRHYECLGTAGPAPKQEEPLKDLQDFIAVPIKELLRTLAKAR
jgi:hypothetical protein